MQRLMDLDCSGNMERSIELEADNITLVSIAERNIKSLLGAVRVLKTHLETPGPFYLSTLDAISNAEDDIARSREFLNKLFQEGNYPQN